MLKIQLVRTTGNFYNLPGGCYCNAQNWFPLAEFLVDVLGNENFDFEIAFLQDPKRYDFGYDTSHLEKRGEEVIISSLYGNLDVEVKIPKNKFIQLLKALKKFAYLRREKIKAECIIFEFDNEWNCKITPRYKE